MKLYKTNYKNTAYFLYRLVEPIVDPIKFFMGLFNYVFFIRDVVIFSKNGDLKNVVNFNMFPQLHDKTKLTPFDAHYFHQQLWAFEKVLESEPKEHIDIGSTYEFSGYLSKIVKTTFVEIRPIDTNLKNLTIKEGNILELPFADNSIESLSCLHVIEHIGLGRYGDELDPDGMKKSCKELERILRKGGKLYLTTPVGKKRLCFNAHRITPTTEILNQFPNLKLQSFSAVDAEGNFIENCDYKDYDETVYSCGMFEFTKL